VSEGKTRRFASNVGLVLIVALFAPVFLALQASPAIACQCTVRTSIHHLAEVDVVFTGRLTEVEGPPANRLTYSSADTVDYQFEVDRVLKGVAPANATVRSVVVGSLCGLEQMVLGDRYTVFAVARDGQLNSGSCSDTHMGSPDPAVALVSGALLAPAQGAPPWWVIMLVAIAAILGATVSSRGWGIFRNQRRSTR
jgi:hypothetical protein